MAYAPPAASAPIAPVGTDSPSVSASATVASAPATPASVVSAGAGTKTPAPAPIPAAAAPQTIPATPESLAQMIEANNGNAVNALLAARVTITTEVLAKVKADVTSLPIRNLLLMHAAVRGDAAAVRDLLGKGADVNASDPKSQTPLFLAALNGHAAVVGIFKATDGAGIIAPAVEAALAANDTRLRNLLIFGIGMPPEVVAAIKNLIAPKEADLIAAAKADNAAARALLATADLNGFIQYSKINRLPQNIVAEAIIYANNPAHAVYLIDLCKAGMPIDEALLSGIHAGTHPGLKASVLWNAIAKDMSLEMCQRLVQGSMCNITIDGKDIVGIAAEMKRSDIITWLNRLNFPRSPASAEAAAALLAVTAAPVPAAVAAPAPAPILDTPAPAASASAADLVPAPVAPAPVVDAPAAVIASETATAQAPAAVAAGSAPAEAEAISLEDTLKRLMESGKVRDIFQFLTEHPELMDYAFALRDASEPSRQLQFNTIFQHLLISSAIAGNVALGRRLIEDGVDVNRSDGLGLNALCFAVQNRQADFITLLRANRAVVTTKVIETALAVENTDILTAAIADGALHKAIAENDLAKVRALKNAGADLNELNSDGLSPLTRAIQLGHPEIAQYLATRKRVNVDAAGPNADTALIAAAEKGQHYRLVRTLLARGADVNKQGKCGQTALIAACSHRSFITAGILLNQEGIDVHHQGGTDQYGGAYNRSALHWAAYYVKTEIVKRLLAIGAAVDCKDSSGDTPLMLSVTDYPLPTPPVPLVGGVLHPRAAAHWEKLYGKTSLMLAAGTTDLTPRVPAYSDAPKPLSKTIKEAQSTVNCLIAAGADIYTRNNWRETAYDICPEGTGITGIKSTHWWPVGHWSDSAKTALVFAGVQATMLAGSAALWYLRSNPEALGPEL